MAFYDYYSTVTEAPKIAYYDANLVNFNSKKPVKVTISSALRGFVTRANCSA